MKTVVIVGAGCSKGLAGLPTDISFMQENYKDIHSAYFLNEALNLIYDGGTIITIPTSRIDSWKKERLEVCWNEIDENGKNPKIFIRSERIDNWMFALNEIINNENKKKYKYYTEYFYRDPVSRSHYKYLFMFAEWELKKLVSDKLGCVADNSILLKYRSLIEKINKIAQEKVHAYISFNYDTLIEQALNGFVYLGPDNRSHLNNYLSVGLIPFLKPHGSLNWLLKLGQEKGEGDLKPFEVNQIDRLITSCEMGFHSSDLYQPAIISMVGSKQEQAPFSYGEVNVLNHMFSEIILRSVSDVIKDAEQLVIIGYSFPLTDGYVKNALAKAIPGKIKKILLITKPEGDDAEKSIGSLKEKIAQLFRVDKEIIEIYSKGIENWINEPM